MTDNNGISLPQSSALRPQGWEVEVEVISTDLTDEQRALVVQVKQLSAVVHMAGFERAKRLRLLRESFPKVSPGAKGDSAKDRPGWEAFLRREFDTNAKDVNLEIAGLEAAGEKLDEVGEGALPHQILQEIGSSHLNAIGRGSTPAIRRKIWDMLLGGTLNLNQRAILEEVKKQNKDSTRVGLKALPPPEPPKSPSALPKPRPPGQRERKLSLSKYGPLPNNEKELTYLKGTESANEKLDTAIREALRKPHSGKIARLKVLASALHREFKSIGDRYQNSWDSDRNYPDYMTLWQHIWASEEEFHLHAELEEVRRDIAEANRYFGIAVMRTFSEDLEVVE